MSTGCASDIRIKEATDFRRSQADAKIVICASRFQEGQEAPVAEVGLLRHCWPMKSLVGSVIVAVLPFAMTGCVGRAKAVPFTVVVRGPASSCFTEVDGRKVTTDELLAIARSEVKPGRAARIDADMAQTPYRCIGGTIYTLQMAGFRDVGFAAKPATKR